MNQTKDTHSPSIYKCHTNTPNTHAHSPFVKKHMTRPLSSPPSPPPLDQVNSDFVAILAALLCALICLLGLLAVARCAWLRRSAASNNPPPEANKGLKKKVLRSLPTQPYSHEFAEADCAICLAEFADGDQLRVLPRCGHGFHVACIDTWLGSHSSCPSCRQILVVGRCRKCGGVPSEAEGRWSNHAASIHQSS